MPITINEVQINTTVNEGSSNSSSSTSAASGGGNMSVKEKEQIIQECLRRVAEMLETLKER
jgi:hypothetical protein